MQYGIFLLIYAAFWVVFLMLAGILGYSWPAQIPAVDLLLLCMATFRITEMITEEKVARCLRAPFCEVKRIDNPDGTTTEEEVPSGRGFRRVTGEMLLCPWCAGVWVATFLTFFWLMLPGLARAFLLVFSVAAGGLLFQIFTKLLDRTRQSIGN